MRWTIFLATLDGLSLVMQSWTTQHMSVELPIQLYFVIRFHIELLVIHHGCLTEQLWLETSCSRIATWQRWATWLRKKPGLRWELRVTNVSLNLCYYFTFSHLKRISRLPWSRQRRLLPSLARRASGQRWFGGTLINKILRLVVQAAPWRSRSCRACWIDLKIGSIPLLLRWALFPFTRVPKIATSPSRLTSILHKPTRRPSTILEYLTEHLMSALSQLDPHVPLLPHSMLMAKRIIDLCHYWIPLFHFHIL